MGVGEASTEGALGSATAATAEADGAARAASATSASASTAAEPALGTGDLAGGRPTCSCFPAGTQVDTPRGKQGIASLKVGDAVLAEDPGTGKVEAEPVLAVIDDGIKPLLQLALSDGSSLRVTANHPFYADGGPGIAAPGWVLADALRVGDRLRSERGADLTVTGVRYHVGTAHVYTLTVANDHTFFVGDGVPVLVHNCDGNAPLPPAAPTRSGSPIDFVVGPDGIAAPVAEISLQYKSFMPRNEFIKKATALQELGEQWQLVKASNPVARDQTVTRGYRQDLIRRIWAQYRDPNPELVN